MDLQEWNPGKNPLPLCQRFYKVDNQKQNKICLLLLLEVWKVSFAEFSIIRLLLCRSLTQLLIVSFIGMLVNKDSTSRLTIYNELSYVVISLEKLKESLILHSLWVRGSITGIKNLTILYPEVFVADRIDQNKNKNL